MAQQRFQDPATGKVYEAVPGGYVEVQTAPPAATTIPLGPRDPLRVKADARADAAADRSAAADERRARAEERRLAIAEAEERRKQTGGTGKAMRQGDADKLETQINAYSYLKDAVGTFDDKFAGNAVSGELENWAQGKLGTGTPGQRDWWANFRTADNMIRNALFGASLTSGEKAAYASTTVDPSMKPEIVRQNLARRAQIAKDVLSRRVSRLHTTYNKDEVEAALGEFGGELLPADVRKERNIPDPAPEDRTVATGDTRTEKVVTDADKKVAAMLASGKSAGTIKAFVKSNNLDYPKLDSVLAWRSLNPGYKGGYDVSAERVVPTTLLNKVMASPLATIATQAANATTMGGLDEIGGAVQSLVTGDPLSETIAAADLAKQAQANLNPNSALAGNVIGGTAAMMAGGAGLARLGIGRAGWLAANPVKAAALGDAAYGAGYGLGENNDARFMGAAIGAPAALAGSFAGSAAANIAGRAVRGVINPAAEALRARGIPLTGAEVLGGGWKKAQDALTSIPVVGGMVARRNIDGREAFNRAAFNEGGQPIGVPINAVGQQGIEALNAAKSQAYSQALDPTRISLLDPQFQADVNAIGSQVNAIPNVDNASDAARAALLYRMATGTDPATGEMSGRGFQEAYRGLARAGRERGPNQAYAHEFGQAMRSGQDALAGALERQAPDAYQGFVNANSANRHLSILADAVNTAKNQVQDESPLFTPAQLGTAATNNTKKMVSKAAAARGDRPFNELALQGQEVLSPKIADSGTTARAATGLILTSLGGAGAGYGTGDAPGAVAGTLLPAAVLTALGTRRGQAALTAALLARTQAWRRLGQGIVDRAPDVGAIGASATLPFIGQ